MILKTKPNGSAGSVTRRTSISTSESSGFVGSSGVGAVGWGWEIRSLNTGEARERTSLWTRKSRSGVRRMMSASGASNFSMFDVATIVCVGWEEVRRGDGGKARHRVSRLNVSNSVAGPCGVLGSILLLMWLFMVPLRLGKMGWGPWPNVKMPLAGGIFKGSELDRRTFLGNPGDCHSQGGEEAAFEGHGKKIHQWETWGAHFVLFFPIAG